MEEKAVYRTELSPLNFLQRSARTFYDRTAVIYGEKSYTYGSLYDRTHRLATALMAAGVSKGDRVAFLAPNIPPLLEAHYGVPLAGGVLVAINIRLSGSEIAYILNHSGSKVLVVDAEFNGLIEGIKDQLETVELFVTIHDVPGSAPDLPGPDYEDFLASADLSCFYEAIQTRSVAEIYTAASFSEEGLKPPLLFNLPAAPFLDNEDEPLAINYTSGTTGKPKGVMYSHRNATMASLGAALEVGLNSSSRFMYIVPMFHCNGWCFPWGVTAIGATHVCLRKADPNAMLEAIERSNVTHFCGAPTVLISFINNPTILEHPLSHPVRVATGGAPPSPALIEAANKVGIDLQHVYGLTEIYGPAVVCEWQPDWTDLPLEGRAKLVARQGVANATTDNVRVVDSDMNDTPADGETLGEVVVRGNTVMLGYYNQEEETAKAFAGGWFHSGDLAVMHRDGYIELRDRKKDIIISGGENISTIEIENALAHHPAVLELAVVAIPDEKWGEVPKAYVTLKPGASASPEELIAFCRTRLAHFKAPKQIAIIDELPKTSTGKIQKFVLREKEWAGKDKRIN